MSGLIHIYCGDGKGKTTAALGLSLRAAGRGMQVCIVQFLKSTETGRAEHPAADPKRSSHPQSGAAGVYLPDERRAEAPCGNGAAGAVCQGIGNSA